MMRNWCCRAMLGFATLASAQSFNLDIGQTGTAPPNSYGGAANQPGYWLSLPCTQGVSVFNLTDIHGNVTNARLSQIGGTQTLLVNDPDLSGGDATLMNDYLITYTTVENCLFFRDMEPGEYEVFIYARMPAQPTVMAYTSVDQELGFPHLIIGDAWPGQHQEFVSYSRHTATVGANGYLYLHSGVVPGGNFTDGAAVNGVQIHKIVPNPDDLSGDGVVGVPDLLMIINAWGPCDARCPEDIAPTPSDGSVGVPDLLFLINNWG